MKKPTLWTKNFTTLTVATVFGAIGGVMGGFALSIHVYAETASTLASALVIALRVIPGFLVPVFISPLMDRLPRKPFLVGCDALFGVVYILAGIWLRTNEFNYIYYLLFSLLVSTMGSIDELSYNAIYPKIIPVGMEEKGYSVSSMLYPLLSVITMPLAAWLYNLVGVGYILIGQGILCLLAALTENTIKLREKVKEGTDFSFRQWCGDIGETTRYLKKEKGLLNMTVYSGITNGMGAGYESILVAFFSSTPGLSTAMYGFFTVAEFIGRTIGGTFLYKKPLKKEKKYGFALFVYFFYEIMDGLLLWLPYPLMLVNRAASGFLGTQSFTLRYAATQKYIPDAMRARINAFQSMSFTAFEAVLSLGVGWLGEMMDLRLVMTVCGSIGIVACLLTNVRAKKDVEKIYLSEAEPIGDEA